MGRMKGLLAAAGRDLRLADRYANLKEYATATLLYTKAMEKSLKAYFQNKLKVRPPNNATMEYLAKSCGVPREMLLEESEEVMIESENASEIKDYYDDERIDEAPERKVARLRGTARRLVDYVIAYTSRA